MMAYAGTQDERESLVPVLAMGIRRVVGTKCLKFRNIVPGTQGSEDFRGPYERPFLVEWVGNLAHTLKNIRARED